MTRCWIQVASHHVNLPKYHKLSEKHIVYHPAVTAVSIPVAMVIPNFCGNFDVPNNPDLNREVLILMVEIVNLWLQSKRVLHCVGFLKNHCQGSRIQIWVSKLP